MHTCTGSHHLLPAPAQGRGHAHCLALSWLQVTYLPFTEAFDRAKAEKKLVHSILLWGALDDQSC